MDFVFVAAVAVCWWEQQLYELLEQSRGSVGSRLGHAGPQEEVFWVMSGCATTDPWWAGVL